MGIRHSLQGTNTTGQFDGFLFGEKHQRRVNRQLAVHAQPDGQLERLQGILATIGITAVIRLCHPGDQLLDAALIRIGCRKRQENQVATGHKSVG